MNFSSLTEMAKEITMEDLTGLLYECRYLLAVAALLLLIRHIRKKWGDKITRKIRLWVVSAKFRHFNLPRHLIPDKGGWFPVERTVCEEYYKLYATYRVDLDLYDKSTNYLRKVHELGRKPLPFPGWLIIGILMLAESVVFGMVISDLGLDSVTPNEQIYYAILIGVVIATVLTVMTHITGKEWHRNDLLNLAGELSKEDLRSGKVKSASALAKNTKVSIDENGLDDHQPVYVQLLNRLKTNFNLSPDRRWIKGTCAMIIALGLLSFTARLSITDLSDTDAFGQETAFSAFSVDDLDELADGETGMDGDMLAISGKLSVLLIFALMFLGIQAVSVYLGREYGFVGIESFDAYNNIKNFRTRQEYLNHHQAIQLEVINAAQTKLNTLQQLITEQVVDHGIDADAYDAAQQSCNRTFIRYIQLKIKEEKSHEKANLQHTDHNASDNIISYGSR